SLPHRWHLEMAQSIRWRSGKWKRFTIVSLLIVNPGVHPDNHRHHRDPLFSRTTQRRGRNPMTFTPTECWIIVDVRNGSVDGYYGSTYADEMSERVARWKELLGHNDVIAANCGVGPHPWIGRCALTDRRSRNETTQIPIEYLVKEAPPEPWAGNAI